MATGLGIVAFDGVGLDNTDGVYRKAGSGGFDTSVPSRLIDLGANGVFDPDAGVDLVATEEEITESYRIQAAEATASAKALAIKAKVGAVGLLTRGNGATLTGRLMRVVGTPVKSGINGSDAIYDVECTWEIVP